MPATGFSRIEPGDGLTAASLTGLTNGIATAINDLPIEAVEPESLTRQHLPSVLVGTAAAAALNLAIGAEATYSSAAGAEPYPGWETVAGWKVVNDVGTATGPNLLRVTGLGVTLSSSVGIEVWGSTEIVDIVHWNTGGGALAGAAARSFRVLAIFAIQYSNDAVTWYHVPRSERYLHGETDDNAANATGTAKASILQQGKRVTIATVIKHDDPGGAIEVNYVRMVVSCSALGLAADSRVRLRQSTLDAEGFQFGTLS